MGVPAALIGEKHVLHRALSPRTDIRTLLEPMGIQFTTLDQHDYDGGSFDHLLLINTHLNLEALSRVPHGAGVRAGRLQVRPGTHRLLIGALYMTTSWISHRSRVDI
eukprot:9475990-Pyramimonas_sp.AAC.1